MQITHYSLRSNFGGSKFKNLANVPCEGIQSQHKVHLPIVAHGLLAQENDIPYPKVSFVIK
jgi:hypothetical protein